MKLIALAAACLLLAVPTPAQAGPRPAPPPLPADVWVNPPADLSLTTYFTIGMVSRYTHTKLICAYPTPGHDGCAPAPCPSYRMCLTIRWGEFTNDALDARLNPMLCTNRCKAAVLELNREGPLFGGYNPWGPFQHRLLLERWIGAWAGLPMQSTCVSSMSHHSCSIEGFTPTEAVHLAGW